MLRCGERVWDFEGRPEVIKRALERQTDRTNPNGEDGERDKRPLLTSAHRVARLQWAKRHKNWTGHDWKREIGSAHV